MTTRRLRSHTGAEAGFTLLEMSIVLLIVAFIAGGAITYATARIDAANQDQTASKMDAIEQAVLMYRITNDRIPCPADPTLTTTDANFGAERGSAGACTAANILSSGNVYAGVVPVRTLSLPDDFMYDAWGRSIHYSIDQRYTATGAFTALPISGATSDGSIIVNDGAGVDRSSGGSDNKDRPILLLLSYGPNGHGGYTRAGGATRYSSSSADADELNNCNCNASAAATAFNVTYVQKNPTNTFDDIVRFRVRWQISSPSER